MDSKSILLLRTLLLSTSRLNKSKYAKDKKVKKKAIGNLIGVSILYLMIMFYCIMTCIGYGQVGIADSIPVICAATISLLAFVFTIFKTNGYLFHFKEYDMLMSLPFEPKTIAQCKFLYMYFASLPWYLSISLSMMIGYGIYEKPRLWVYPLWLLLSLLLPMVPMVLATFIGFLLAKISSGFKLKKLVQSILTFAFVIFCFSLQYIIKAIVKSDNQKDVLEGISGGIADLGAWYLPISCFDGAIRELRLMDVLALVFLSVIFFEAIFLIVGKNYRKINSSFKTYTASKDFVMTRQKKRSVVNAIAFKEFRRLTASTTYLVNAAMGEVLTVCLSIVALIFGLDQIIEVVTEGAPLTAEMIYPAIPFVVYFFIGMVATTAITPSLEGKNYWIMQSLPIEKKTMYQGKMLFNLYLTIPFAVLGTACLCISAKVPLGMTLVFFLEIIALCLFSTCWGCVCGIRHMKLDWENEIEVVKQGAAVSIYLLPNMFGCMGLVVLVVFLACKVDALMLSLAMTFLFVILADICYIRVLSLAKK